jgi:Fe-S-cluster containining protein
MSDSGKDWFERGLRFDCGRCGDCCTGAPGHVWFDAEELGEMARHLGILPFQFLRDHARQDPASGRWSLLEVRRRNGDHDCEFLRRGGDGLARCAIQAVKPRQCRTFPFWKEILASEEAWRARAGRCLGMRRGQDGEGTLHDADAIRRARDSNPS